MSDGWAFDGKLGHCVSNTMGQAFFERVATELAQPIGSLDIRAT